jgi:hypothetical protein
MDHDAGVDQGLETKLVNTLSDGSVCSAGLNPNRNIAERRDLLDDPHRPGGRNHDIHDIWSLGKVHQSSNTWIAIDGVSQRVDGSDAIALRLEVAVDRPPVLPWVVRSTDNRYQRVREIETVNDGKGHVSSNQNCASLFLRRCFCDIA